MTDKRGMHIKWNLDLFCSMLLRLQGKTDSFLVTSANTSSEGMNVFIVAEPSKETVKLLSSGFNKTKVNEVLKWHFIINIEGKFIVSLHSPQILRESESCSDFILFHPTPPNTTRMFLQEDGLDHYKAEVMMLFILNSLNIIWVGLLILYTGYGLLRLPCGLIRPTHGVRTRRTAWKTGAAAKIIEKRTSAPWQPSSNIV